mmetsp:Transcript_18140/g.54209  ORF Transcript_18140/g.54209 Transcript_18140/m.54209 type:complete len:280 (+) Transcript_18140:591-1430(+)
MHAQGTRRRPAAASAATNSSPASTAHQSMMEYKMPTPDMANANAWHNRRRSERRGKSSASTRKETFAEPPSRLHSDIKLSPCSGGSNNNGIGGKPQRLVRQATRKSVHNDAVPIRGAAGNSGRLLMTNTADAPARAAICAFIAKHASCPGAAPRRTTANPPPSAPGPTSPSPKGLAASKRAGPAISSPACSAFQNARCAKTDMGSCPATVSSMGCRSIRLGNASVSRISFNRSSSNSIITRSGATASKTARTSRGARGEMCNVATRNSCCPSARALPQV